jgi:hypothetical protein
MVERISKSDGAELALKTLLGFLVFEGSAPQKRQWSISNLLGDLPEGQPDFSLSSFSIDRFSSHRELYDVSGKLVFRDYTATLSDGSQLLMRVSGNRGMGPPVWSVGINKKFDVDLAIVEATKVAERLRLRPREGKKSLVCYSYPKLGLLCSAEDGSKVIIDLGDLSTVRVDAVLANSPELLATWSPLALLEDAFSGRSREAYFSYCERLKAIDLESNIPLNTAVEGAQNTTEESTLRQCGSGATGQCMSLRGQETPVYCAVATAQMILAYHGIDKTQTEIALSMQTGQTGTTNPNQVAGYQSLSGSIFTGTFDSTASFLEAKREIDEGRPLKSGVPGHARACSGWRTETSADGTETQWIQVYDPWPPNAGAIYWEAWSNTVHTNFIYVRRTTIS